MKPTDRARRIRKLQTEVADQKRLHGRVRKKRRELESLVLEQLRAESYRWFALTWIRKVLRTV